MGLSIFREQENRIEIIGTLETDGSFAYSEGYLANPDARALSFSLPLRKEPYPRTQAAPYFQGLLPEGRIIFALAARLGRSVDDYPGLLSECGLDCVGDVIIQPVSYNETQSYRKTCIEEIRQEFCDNVAGGAAKTLAASRLSLAGAQDKIGLFLPDSQEDLGDDRGWYLPQGGAPSNCILKVASEQFLPDLMIAEQLAMACAHACGVNAAETELAPIGRGALITKRFDRSEYGNTIIDGMPAPNRRHQEDFSQAFGLPPASKYAELEGGTIAALASFLRNNSAAPVLDIRCLMDICLFNYAIGNADNHLKNLSLLYSPDWKSVRLAPAYDLVPTTYYPRFTRVMGMAIGSARNIDEVEPSDILALAEQLDVSKRMLGKSCKLICKTLLPALHTEAERLDNRGFPDAPYIADDMEEDIAPRLEVLSSI